MSAEHFDLDRPNPKALNNTVWMALQDVFLVGVFTDEDQAKAACQAHYDSYVPLKPTLTAQSLDWRPSIDINGVPSLRSQHMGGQVHYQISPVPVNVNVRMKTYSGT